MRYPIVLSHHAVRRLVEGRASAIIFERKLKLGRYGIEDALIRQRNSRACRNGRPDQQEDPLVLSIELISRDSRPLLDLDLKTIRRAGFKTSEDFYLDWLARRRKVTVGQDVNVYGFFAVAQERFLHSRVHRGYTSDPSLAARGEPEALSADDLERVIQRWREPTEAGRMRAQRGIALRAKSAALRGDAADLLSLASELAAMTAMTVGSAIV